MDTYKVEARNTTIPIDQLSTMDMGYQSPWETVEVEAVSDEDAIAKSKVEGKLPTRLYVDHRVVKS